MTFCQGRELCLQGARPILRKPRKNWSTNCFFSNISEGFWHREPNSPLSHFCWLRNSLSMRSKLIKPWRHTHTCRQVKTQACVPITQRNIWSLTKGMCWIVAFGRKNKKRSTWFSVSDVQFFTGLCGENYLLQTCWVWCKLSFPVI